MNKMIRKILNLNCTIIYTNIEKLFIYLYLNILYDIINKLNIYDICINSKNKKK